MVSYHRCIIQDLRTEKHGSWVTWDEVVSEWWEGLLAVAIPGRAWTCNSPGASGAPGRIWSSPPLSGSGPPSDSFLHEESRLRVVVAEESQLGISPIFTF